MPGPGSKIPQATKVGPALEQQMSHSMSGGDLRVGSEGSWLGKRSSSVYPISTAPQAPLFLGLPCKPQSGTIGLHILLEAKKKLRFEP